MDIETVIQLCQIAKARRFCRARKIFKVQTKIEFQNRPEVNIIFENIYPILNYEPKLNLLGLDMLLGRFMCTPDHLVEKSWMNENAIHDPRKKKRP